MQEGNFYSAYPHVLKQISDSAHIEKVIASPFDGVLDSARIEQANEDRKNFYSSHRMNQVQFCWSNSNKA